jgi:hypothetical protein
MGRIKGYHLIKPMHKRGEIKVFTDIFIYAYKSVVAKDLGKEKGRFNELIEKPDEFTYMEVRRMANHFEMEVFTTCMVIMEGHPNDQPETLTYEEVKIMHEEGKIKSFDDIFEYVYKSNVAESLGKNRQTFDRLLNHVEDFTIKDIRSMGELFGLTFNEIFAFIHNKYEKKLKKP